MSATASRPLIDRRPRAARRQERWPLVSDDSSCFPCASQKPNSQAQCTERACEANVPTRCFYISGSLKNGSLRRRRRVGAQQTSHLEVGPERYRNWPRKAFDVASDLGGRDGADHDRGDDGMRERELDRRVRKRDTVPATDLVNAAHALEDLRRCGLVIVACPWHRPGRQNARVENPAEENRYGFLFGNPEEDVEGGLIEKRVAPGQEHAVEIAGSGEAGAGLRLVDADPDSLDHALVPQLR